MPTAKQPGPCFHHPINGSGHCGHPHGGQTTQTRTFVSHPVGFVVAGIQEAEQGSCWQPAISGEFGTGGASGVSICIGSLSVGRCQRADVRRFARPVPRHGQVAHVVTRDCRVYFTVVWVTPFITARVVLSAGRECVTARPFPSVFTFRAVEVTPPAPNHGMQRTRRLRLIRIHAFWSPGL